MEKWARFEISGDIKFGKISNNNEDIIIYEGNLFDNPSKTDN